MATKKSNKPVKKAEWKGYHKINLTNEQDAMFEDWVVSSGVSMVWLEGLIDDGYKVSFSFDEYHSGVSCALYCTDAKKEWAGYSLTAWGGNAGEAFYMICYKHYAIANQMWEIVPERSEKSYKSRG